MKNLKINFDLVDTEKITYFKNDQEREAYDSNIYDDLCKTNSEIEELGKHLKKCGSVKTYLDETRYTFAQTVLNNFRKS
jgi:hypothetical protein